MCGITGFISPRFRETELQSLTQSIQHRGPDAEGIFFAPAGRELNIGLGHRRLSIIDLSAAANQPFYSHDRRHVMIFNGELYNYKEVKEKYRIETRTNSDSEVIIETISRYGTDVLKDFNGMFSLAIWDQQEQELLLIRDRVGKKPMLYYHNGDEMAFASELKAFFKLPVQWSINKEALNDYLFLEYVPGNQCILNGVKKLPAGHFLKYRNGEITIQSYYSIFDKFEPAAPSVPNEKAYLEKFYETLSSSIKYRQVSDVPIGAFLSGGTDSSLICAIFQEQNKQPINTFTIGFDVAKFDETAYANRVADILHSNHRVYHLTDKDSLSIVDKLVDYYDEPFAAPSCIPSYLVCKKAREVATVAMSGDGGDELFMGYGYYDLYRRLKRIYRNIPGIGRKVMAELMKLRKGRYERGSRLMNLPNDDDMFIRLWAEEQYMFNEREISALTGTKYKHNSLTGQWRKINSMPLHDHEKISLFDFSEYLSNNLMYKMDSASMANSLEVRNPYLDYRLVEQALNIPLHYKIHNGEQKYLMKKLLERYLPKDLVYRRKWGFPAPIGDWLYTELSYLPDKWLNEERIKSQGIFDYKEVKRWLDLFRSGKKHHYKRIWALIIFQMWHERYFGS